MRRRRKKLKKFEPKNTHEEDKRRVFWTKNIRFFLSDVRVIPGREFIISSSEKSVRVNEYESDVLLYLYFTHSRARVLLHTHTYLKVKPTC